MNTLKKSLDSFIKGNLNAPAQKSARWKLIKEITIGGSEVSTVLGLNPYKKVHSLIAEKTGLADVEFKGNIATRWGNLFESVTRDYTVLVLQMESDNGDCPIQETGSLEGVVERQRYSPDGIGIVKLSTGQGNQDYFLVLFEFKAPLRSVPDMRVPKHYMPQIQTGLVSIPIAETGLFVNNMYRKCALKDLNFGMEYDHRFHDGDKKKKLTKRQAITQVYAVGMICFYQTDEEYEKYVSYCGYGDSDEENDFDPNSIDPLATTSEYDIDLLLNSHEQPIDLGTSKLFIMDRLLELYDEKRIHAVYLPMVCNLDVLNEDEFIQLHNLEQKETKANKVIRDNPRKYLKQQYNKFLTKCDEENWSPIGYLPWKLVKSDIISVDAVDDWVDVIKEPIKNTLSIIDDIRKKNTLEERREVYHTYFPSTEPISKKDRDYIVDGCSDLFDVEQEDSELDE